ncbi:hypothetical protein BST33_10765 [Mycolicibacter minnesotensis]|uniref:Predicted hydrolase N-terminal domain-containing protein n=1 Tax=Mycolicibacter minnesotensis TaxID=1118379 RepID=A0A7I7R8X6_9MYCO|nr:hypothetical protein [Mycolicibacter minnesotensis]ORB00805.1 hypothetical protein BST33_10765 [Mycolicibacter minnesotensis]BBY34490.1 hypothetical protein MMIN_25510 [Mycolicibacter minnesotensis]
MSRPSLQHLQVDELVAHAGGDPWAVDDSLQAGSPTQIDFLAQAFHSAAGSATAAEQTFRTAQEHFAQYNRENGEQPINNGAEVARVKEGLHATTEQLGQIAADLGTIAAALAQARNAAQEHTEALNSNLKIYDYLLGEYLQMEAQGQNHDTAIAQCRQFAEADTATALHNLTLTRSSYSTTPASGAHRPTSQHRLRPHDQRLRRREGTCERRGRWRPDPCPRRHSCTHRRRRCRAGRCDRGQGRHRQRRGDPAVGAAGYPGDDPACGSATGPGQTHRDRRQMGQRR